MARNKEAPAQQQRRRRRTAEPEPREVDDTERALRTLDLFDMLAPTEKRRYEEILDRGPKAESSREVMAQWRNREPVGLPDRDDILPAGRSVAYSSTQSEGAVRNRVVGLRASEE